MTEPRTLSIDRQFGGAEVRRRLGFVPERVIVAGKYELLHRIGRGGQGTVYKALDRELDREVAVKVRERCNERQVRLEGHALAKLSHPNVVRVYEAGQEFDYRYYVLELLDGPTLREWWVGKSPEQIIAKFCEAARGLAAAHAAGLVHRDFKPSNVRIGRDGRAVVVDFGLARNLEQSASDLAEVGVVAGTLAYTAPERLLGQPGDERSDQFSFCVALWEALSGANPFGPTDTLTTTGERYNSILAGYQWTLRGPARVQRALARGLSAQPSDRLDRIEDLADLLSAKPRRRWRTWIVSAGLTIAMVAAICPGRSSPQLGDLVGHRLVRVDAMSAVVMAATGDDQGAITLLERAQRARPTAADARVLTAAGVRVAHELERQAKTQDAYTAWAITIMLAREAGDIELERFVDQSLADFVSRSART